jgi:hypothetical protein
MSSCNSLPIFAMAIDKSIKGGPPPMAARVPGGKSGAKKMTMETPAKTAAGAKASKM